MNKKIIAVTVLLSVMVIASCHSYYRARKISNNRAAASIDSLGKANRFLILRNGDQAWHMRNIAVAPDQRTANCILEPLPFEHSLHIQNGIDGKMGYKQNDPERVVINEVHFYTPEDSTVNAGQYTLQLDRIYQIEVLEHDKKRTTTNYIVGTVGVVLSVAAISLIIIAATKSSCPFISAYDGTGFSLQGEIFGGAVYPQLSRYDYLPLKMKPMEDGSLQLKITNELKERQFTDFVRLWKVSHSKHSRIYVDEKGNLFSAVDPQLPEQALLNGNRDVSASLEKPNDHHIFYPDDSSRTDARNEITLRFNKPADATSGRLILVLRNSYFLDLLYGELAKGFGTLYPLYAKHQKKRSKETLLKWVKEQQIPLEIDVRRENGWSPVKSLPTVGPLAFRETAIEVNLSGIKGNKVEIKMGSGFMFWEIDYVAMDFTAAVPFTVEKLDPVTATDETGKNVLPELLREDGIYLDQPSIGNAATIAFRNDKAESGEVQTYILECRGYYESLRKYDNPPDLKFLEQFRKPGAFPLFGLNLYRKIKKESFALINPN